MFSNNNGISIRQLKRLLVFDLFSVSMVAVPYIATISAGKNGLAAIIMAAVLAALYGSLLFSLGKNIISVEGAETSVSFLNYSKKAVGRVGTLVFCLFYFMKFIMVMVFLLNLFAGVISDTLLPDTSQEIIIATLLLTASYGASRGIEKRARLTEVLYFIVLVPFVIFLVLGLRKVDLGDIAPLISNVEGKYSILRAGYLVFLTYTALELMLFALPYLKKNSQWKKVNNGIFQAIAITAVLQILIYIVTVGILGVNEAESKIWSAVTTMQVVELPGGFIRRQDSIMLAFWVISIFTVLSSYFFYLIHISYDWIRFAVLDFFKMPNLYKSMKRKYFIVFYLILIFWLGTAAINGLNGEVVFRYVGLFIAYAGIPGSLLIPLIILGSMKLRQQVEKYDKRRVSTHEK